MAWVLMALGAPEVWAGNPPSCAQATQNQLSPEIRRAVASLFDLDQIRIAVAMVLGAGPRDREVGDVLGPEVMPQGIRENPYFQNLGRTQTDMDRGIFFHENVGVPDLDDNWASGYSGG